MTNPNPLSPKELSKDELIQLLKIERAKSRFLHDLFVTISFEFRTPATVIQAYANLILQEESGFFPKLTEKQSKSIESMKSAGDRIHEMVRLMSSKVRAYQYVQSPPSKTKVVLAELKGLEVWTDFGLSNLARISPVFADEGVITALFDLLGFELNIHYQEELKISIYDEGDWIRFNFINIRHRPIWLDDYLGDETNRISCNEAFQWSQPFCLVIDLVEKYGGAVYAELGSNSTYSLSITLPVYQEGS
ncbi:sensor histidine kinase [Candidatus Leptofilum sp.]|uniref:sensor histidine kinase n=1 Tax=Candidatus Leptofilum sp. TaxID=3241576 RepID=UPI003B59F882